MTTIAQFRTETQAEPAILKWIVSRDDIDHDAILQAINRSNQLSDWQMGYIDAAEGAPFAPESYHTNSDKMVQYANGFLTCKPQHEIARRFIFQREQPSPQPELFVVAQPAAQDEPPWLHQFDDEPTDDQKMYFYEHDPRDEWAEQEWQEQQEQINMQRQPWQY